MVCNLTLNMKKKKEILWIFTSCHIFVVCVLKSTIQFILYVNLILMFSKFNDQLTILGLKFYFLRVLYCSVTEYK